MKKCLLIKFKTMQFFCYEWKCERTWGSSEAGQAKGLTKLRKRPKQCAGDKGLTKFFERSLPTPAHPSFNSHCVTAL